MGQPPQGPTNLGTVISRNFSASPKPKPISGDGHSTRADQMLHA